MSLGSGSASTTSSTSTTTTTHSLGEKTPPFWELDVSSALVIDANGQQQQQQQSLPPVTSQSNTFNNSYNYITKSNNNNNNPLMVWMSKQLRSSAATAASLPIDVVPSVAQTLCQHVFRSVSALLLVEESQLSTNGGTSSSNNNNHNNIINHHNEEEEDPDNTDRPEANRKKRKKTVPIRRFLMDPYKIWFQSGDSATPAEVGSSEVGSTAVSSAAVALLATAKPWDDNQDDIPETAGGKLAVLSVGGLLNALAGQVVCTASTVVGNNLNALQKQAVLSGTANALAKTFGTGITILQLHAVASALHTAIADQVKLDILRTTPNRIHNLLAPDLTVAEFQSIRRRVYDTVILGKGLSSSDHNDASSNDLPTAASGAVHDIEKFKKCNLCGNNNQSDFILDRKNGDLICEHCGAIVSESIMHEGSQFRKFEGEVDRNHHGDAGNALYSNAHNMGTSLSGVAPTTGAGMGGWGSGGGSSGSRRNLETILKNAHAYTELNVSQFGKTDRRTRIGYKDRQKKDAFIQMTHAGDALNLHEAVVQRAKELFAGFRDDRELIQQFKGVLAACLSEAFEQLSAEGKHLLRQQQQMQDQQQQEQEKLQYAPQQDGKPKPNLSVRASRRSELHHATMAGKGGLLLNKDSVKTIDGKSTSTPANTAANEDNNTNTNGLNNDKPTAAWDLEDCRTWLLEASRNIAQTWVDERKTNTLSVKNIPNGPQAELEGQLVEHTFRLCEHLEAELQARASTDDKKGSTQQKVVTPRLTDMTKLGIKWQHSHERGSGGRGGIGGSGASSTAGVVRKNGSSRTAGQILLLKTAKKLGSILNDPVAGDAIHRELRNLIGKQEALKQKEMRDEATRQRLNQMQRKPWLAARLQQ